MYEWLNLRQVGEITKDSQAYPGFDAELVSDLKASLDAFLDEVLGSESSDYRQLFQADWVYTTAAGRLLRGDCLEAGCKRGLRSGEKCSDANTGSGLLSHPYLMSTLAYQDSTSPIHRGVFLVRYMLGRQLQPPKEAFTPLSPDLHPDLTTRSA